MSVRENLIAAKALIDTPEKWAQGSFGVDGCYCMVGAIEMAEGNWHHYRLRPELTDALTTEVPDGFDVSDELWGTAWGRARILMHYNDHPDTTHADIMALFDRAIASQEAPNV